MQPQAPVRKDHNGPCTGSSSQHRFIMGQHSGENQQRAEAEGASLGEARVPFPSRGSFSSGATQTHLNLPTAV